jgi:class 3 adenylate cyclase
VAAAVVVERKLVCASSPHALWCVITDTEQLNRAIGLAPVALEPRSSADSAARYIARTTAGGLPLEYEERPYEWVENERFTVRRKVLRGAVTLMDNTWELRPLAGGGTELTVRLHFEPRSILLVPVLKVQLGRFANRIVRKFQEVDELLQRDGEAVLPSKRSPQLMGQALAQAAHALRARADARGKRAAADRIVAAVERDPDVLCDRMRPYELADRWGLDRREVLTTCLEAVLSGLLELRWDLVCPSCATATDRLATLGELGPEGHCQLCDIGFELDLDRVVEATFRPAPAVRALDQGPYCIGGPARTPHVLAQAILPKNGEVVLKAPGEPGTYRLFVRGGVESPLEIGETGEASAEIAAGDGGPVVLAPLRLRPGAPLRVVEQGGQERHAKIERVGWTERAATAHDLATLPAFRRTFSGEALRPGLSLRVRSVALVFTDLTASTALYRELGDAPAFRLVQDHFAIIGGAVAEHGGAVVKTMGDSVMAAFTLEAGAVRAAVAMQRAFARFRGERPSGLACELRVGVHAGACYCVTANGVLDYFGQTVNVASRLEGAARGGEIVITAALGERAEQGGWLEGTEVRERFVAELKGVGAIEAVRLLCPQGDGGSGRS